MSIEVLNNMLKEYNPFQAMKDETKRSDFLMKNMSKMNFYSKFRDGKFNIPMVTAQHSNVRSGKLTPISEITKGEHAKPYITGDDLTTLWGSISFTESEIRTYGDAKRAFITLFPSKVNELMENFKELVAIRFLLDGSICKITADSDAANGVVKVSRVERLHKKQRLSWSDGSVVVDAYIRTIDMNKDEVTLYDAETGGAPVDMTVATNSFSALTDVKAYIYDDANHGKMTLKRMLDPAVTSFYNVNKINAGPILQAQEIDLSGLNWSSSTLLEDFFKAVQEPIKRKGKVKVPNIALPYGKFNSLVLKAQNSKRFTASETEVSIGYSKVSLVGAGGEMVVYGVFDLEEDDCGFAIDWENLIFVAPEMFTTGREKGHEKFYMERGEDDYVYVLDIKFQGAIAAKKLSGFGLLKLS